MLSLSSSILSARLTIMHCILSSTGNCALEFGLGAQMAQSVLRIVVARYKSLESSGHPWTQIVFRVPCADLVQGRDYSFPKDCVSVGSVRGRQRMPYNTKGMERFFASSVFKFGTAQIIHKKIRKQELWFLHIPVTFEVPDCDKQTPAAIVGCDLGINFTVTAFGSDGRPVFFPGRTLEDKCVQFKILRRDLQKRGTPSARRRLKRIGQRENRWMQDVNHCVSKTLVSSYPSGTLFVLEDLTGIRSATEKAHHKYRYGMVSWAFYDLRQKIICKVQMAGSAVMTVDPRYTSQQCPVCGHTERGNRNKAKHTFRCRKRGYRSNDDRIGAINLYAKGQILS